MKTLLLSLILFLQTPPPGIITGRVLNADGTPAGKLRISVMPVPDVNTPPGALPGLSNLSETDSAGNFRIEDVAPGRYYVVAGFVSFPTYYPGVRDLSGATIVNVVSNTTVSGVDFRVAAASGGIKVSGRVAGIEKVPRDARAPVTVSLSYDISSAIVQADGSFEIQRVPPGRYFAHVSSPIPNGMSSSVPVEVEDKDVTGVQLDIRRLVEIGGTAIVEGTGPVPQLTVSLANPSPPPSDSTRSVVRINPEKNGSFRLTLPEGEWKVDALNALPPGYSVKSFTYGATDLTRDLLKISPADSRQLQLTLTTASRPPVQVSGRIFGLTGNEARGAVRVTLRSAFYATPLTTIAAPDGSFAFPRVFPGSYTLDLQFPGFNRREPVLPLLAVNDADIRDIRVNVPLKKEIRGKVVLEGNAPLPRLSMDWSSPNGFDNAVAIEPSADGTFKVALFEGDYWNFSLAVPKGYTLKSFLYGTMDPRNAPINISNDVRDFEVHVAVSDLKPVKVSGHAAGLSATAISGGMTVSLKSSSYAQTLNASVAADGSYEFPAVVPGNYVLRLLRPDGRPDTCIPIVVTNVDQRNADVATPTTTAPDGKLRIISAIYGASAGSADVTPLVTKRAQPGMDDFYAAPKWMEVDPANGQTKNLVISYLYDCEDYILSIEEPGPISYDRLVQHANPAARLPLPGSRNDDVTVVAAHWGMGNQFTNVTPRVRQLLSTGDSFIADDAILNVNRSTGGRVLLITYTYQGERKTVYFWRNGQVSPSMLIANAATGVNTPRTSSQTPPWFTDADPFAPRDPGDPGPGIGRSPRKELGIAALLKAIAELKAFTTEERNRDILTATSLAQQALNDAQGNIGYSYPVPGSKSVVGPLRPATKSGRVENAYRALKLALEQLTSANPGANDQLLKLSIDEIQQAMAALEKVPR